MAMPKIEKIEDLLSSINNNKKKTVIGQEVTRLTAPGENYGSLMLAVDITVKSENNGKIELIKAVAKVPPLNKFIQQMFNTAVTFKYEIDFYNYLLPELRKFIINNKQDVKDVFDCFPETYGARLSVDKNSDKVDNSAVLLLENLKVSGFECVDRTIGFDFETAKLILKSLAKLHAVPVAMKLKSPEQFETKIKSHFKEFTIFPLGEEIEKITIDKIIKRLIDIGDEECTKLTDKVRAKLEESAVAMRLPKNSAKSSQEPFATIMHTDTWVNNFMVKFGRDNKAEEVKIVDFQLYEYGTPARDILLFIFTSVQMEVVDNYYDALISAYHEEFIRILTKFGCDINQFSLNALQNEITFVLNKQMFFHILLMLEPILAAQEHVRDLDSLGIEDFSKDNPVSQKYYERVAFVVKKFNQNKWI